MEPPVNRRGHAILIICIACGIIETIAVALRFLARRRIKARLQIDDWFIFASLWPNYIMIVTGGFCEWQPHRTDQPVHPNMYPSVVGEGKAGLSKTYLTRHQMVVFLEVWKPLLSGSWNNAPADGLQMLFASMIFYVCTVTLVRLSILLLYRRIFDIPPFRIITTGLIAACTAWGLAMCAANIFQCHTITDAFRPEVVGALDGRCINLQAMFYGALATGFTLDLVILILPFQQIWNLRLERRQKLELMAILSLGGL